MMLQNYPTGAYITCAVSHYLCRKTKGNHENRICYMDGVISYKERS